MSSEAIEPNSGYVYMQTNEPERNRVLAFRRAGDGTLTPSGAYDTGGAGDGIPHLASQGSVVLTGDGRYLLVTNASSGDVSVFAVGGDGLSLVQTVATGHSPKSVAEYEGLVYVLNTGRIQCKTKDDSNRGKIMAIRRFNCTPRCLGAPPPHCNLRAAAALSLYRRFSHAPRSAGSARRRGVIGNSITICAACAVGFVSACRRPVSSILRDLQCSRRRRGASLCHC